MTWSGSSSSSPPGEIEQNGSRSAAEGAQQGRAVSDRSLALLARCSEMRHRKENTCRCLGAWFLEEEFF